MSKRCCDTTLKIIGLAIAGAQAVFVIVLGIKGCQIEKGLAELTKRKEMPQVEVRIEKEASEKYGTEYYFALDSYRPGKPDEKERLSDVVVEFIPYTKEGQFGEAEVARFAESGRFPLNRDIFEEKGRVLPGNITDFHCLVYYKVPRLNISDYFAGRRDVEEVSR